MGFRCCLDLVARGRDGGSLHRRIRPRHEPAAASASPFPSPARLRGRDSRVAHLDLQTLTLAPPQRIENPRCPADGEEEGATPSGHGRGGPQGQARPLPRSLPR
jgi:hypothetical protein